MKRIYDWADRPQMRNHTVAGLRGQKGARKLTQTTANTEEEACAAAEAGIELLVGDAGSTSAVRSGAPNLFFTASIGFLEHPDEKQLLAEAFRALDNGADCILTGRGPHVVEMLAREDIPVMCQLGLVAHKSTWHGGLKAIGKTSDEALALWQAFKRMENAGAFAAEAGVICDRVMGEISRRTKMVTASLGSGAGADIIYLHQSDICGEQPDSPRHARAYGNLHALYRKIREERTAALAAFRNAVEDSHYPSEPEIVSIRDDEFERFLVRLEQCGLFD